MIDVEKPCKNININGNQMGRLGIKQNAFYINDN